MQHPPPQSPATGTKLSAAARAHLLAEVSALAGATLQKLWLVSSTQVALQLRVPGRTLLVLVDSALALASITETRPAAPDGAPKSQATLRAALEGTRFDGLRLEVARDAPVEAQAPALRLWFTAAAGRKVLLADPRASALVAAAVLAPAEDPEATKVVWAGAGAAPAWRPGQLLAPARALDLSTNTADTAANPPGQTVAAQAQAADEARVELRAQSAAALEAARQAVVRRLRARLKKVERTLAAVEDDSSRAAAAQDDRRKAELLLPHQSKLPRGAREAVVPDWSLLNDDGQPAQVRLALDPALSAAENCARWLRRSTRYGAARGRIDARRAEVAATVAHLRERLLEAEAAPDAAALRALEGEASRSTAQPQPERERPGRALARLPYRTFLSERGARILVGRSAKDNDALTFQRARGNDLWLHVRGVQGSHVVVPEPGEAPDERTLLDAALLAAWFSSAREEEQTEVSWTRKKHVRKPRGGAAGAVLYSQEKTIRLRSDPARLAVLLGREDRSS
jgi:predicted ribosome quality control (RQC) complex YloA/Tae2 family protein